MKKDDIANLVQAGLTELNDALALGRSTRLQELLDVMSRFPQYSFRNCLLILQQRPEAKMVQGFHGWKRIGRSVKKGEKGIGITAPLAVRKKDEGDDDSVIRGFRVVHVFDVEQTEGDPLPEFAEPTGEAGPWLEPMEALFRSNGIELAYEPMPDGTYGYSAKGKVAIQTGLEPARRMSALVHEFAHEQLHRREDSHDLPSHCVRETEAEAVAHIVCRSLGIRSLEHSTDYIHLHQGDSEVLMKSMQRIQKCAADILRELTSHVFAGIRDRSRAANHRNMESVATSA